MATSVPRLPRLGDLERDALEFLWTRGEADVQETHAAVGAKRHISPNTVGSALERLFSKGLLAREKVSHAYRYRPVIDREAFRARKVVEAAGGLESLKRGGLLAAFVDMIAASDASALTELERLVRQKRAEVER